MGDYKGRLLRWILGVQTIVRLTCRRMLHPSWACEGFQKARGPLLGVPIQVYRMLGYIFEGPSFELS